MTKASTWADGHGRWHAVVADTPRGLINAVNAIAHELHTRTSDESTLSEWVGYVNKGIISLPSETPGRIHFAEYALED